MNIIIIHHILEFHGCRFSGDSEKLGELMGASLRKNGLASPGSLSVSQRDEAIYLSQDDASFTLLLQFYPAHKLLFCDLQLKKDLKGINKLFTEIKKVIQARHFSSLEVKRGIWDREASSQAGQ